MVLDTSAVLAILLREPEAQQFLDALYKTPHISISAATLLECEIVVMALLGAEGQVRLHDLLAAITAEVVTFGERELAVARSAYRDYGKGRHPAALNFGDCFSYATAIARGEPLLYKGKDFAQTDVEPAA